MVRLCKQRIPDSQEMRYAYCNALIEAARADSRIVSINCDLSSSCGTKGFAREFPERSFNLGIQEANGCCVAAGMSVTGFIPFFHSFAVFSSRRICDQVFQSCAYAGLNVKIIGCDAGISATYNGGTHMAFEDIGILKMIPNVTIVEPTDTVMIKQLVKQLAETYGVFYMRFARKNLPRVYEEGSRFKIGKAAVIREGKDASVIACGMEVAEALDAAEILSREGIEIRVADMFTIKPIDTECVIDCAAKTGAIVTAENANIIGGLGSAVADVLVENCPVPMERVGVNDEFGEVGELDYLRERFGLSASYIVEKVKKVLERKTGK
jgi:transketolase